MSRISQSPWRLFCALLLSLALHGGVFYFSRVFLWTPPAPPANLLHARIETPAEAPPELIKNTIKPEAGEAAPQPPGRGSGTPQKLSERQMERLMERLSDTLVYPEEARARGLEGEVVLILSQDTQGRMTQIAIAGSSGHAILDEAALRAVRGLRGLGPEFNAKTWLFPVTFELK